MSNAAEDAFAIWAAEHGWVVTKRGWPDFLCFRSDEIMAVEVKWSDTLSRFQERACLMLAAHGIPTFVWSPPGPLEPFEIVPGAVDVAEAQDSYWLAKENLRLRDEIARLQRQRGERAAETSTRIAGLEAELADQQKDLGYLIRLAEWYPHRANRLYGLLRKYAHLTLGIRPKTRRQKRFDVRIDVRPETVSDTEAA